MGGVGAVVVALVEGEEGVGAGVDMETIKEIMKETIEGTIKGTTKGTIKVLVLTLIFCHRDNLVDLILMITPMLIYIHDFH